MSITDQRHVQGEREQSNTRTLIGWIQVWWIAVYRQFFTRDSSFEGRRIADLQRRACWVALALILQCLNEITFASVQALKDSSYNNFNFFLKGLCIITPVLLIVGSFVALWAAFRPVKRQERIRPALWQRIIFVLSIAFAIAGAIVCGVSIQKCFLPPQFSNDGTVLDTNAAAALLQGHNPYGNPTFKNLTLQQVPILGDWTTPLRQGQFQGRLDYPTRSELQRVLSIDQSKGQTVEFESKVSYPAFSFLTLVPFVLFKDDNVLPLYLLCHLLLIVCAWKFARPELRPWVLLLAFANVSTWTATAGETLDMLYTLFIGLAWLFGMRRWWSVLFLGLAVASKQIAWFFVPFYFLMIWQRFTLKESIGRVIGALAIALLINLPFIIWDPSAWYASVLAPVGDPMFPLGTGLINLSTGHLLPYFPEWFYKFLEMGAFALVLAYYWLRCRKCPEAAMILAVIPLFFAWRSLPSYLYCGAFPLLALMMAKHTPVESESASTLSQPVLAST